MSNKLKEQLLKLYCTMDETPEEVDAVVPLVTLSFAPNLAGGGAEFPPEDMGRVLMEHFKQFMENHDPADLIDSVTDIEVVGKSNEKESSR